MGHHCTGKGPVCEFLAGSVVFWMQQSDLMQFCILAFCSFNLPDTVDIHYWLDKNIGDRFWQDMSSQCIILSKRWMECSGFSNMVSSAWLFGQMDVHRFISNLRGGGSLLGTLFVYMDSPVRARANYVTSNWINDIHTVGVAKSWQPPLFLEELVYTHISVTGGA